MALRILIQEIIRIIGHSKAMVLVEHFGGQELRIPKTESSDTWAALVEVIGHSATEAMARHFGGGEPLYIALCSKAIRDDRKRRMITRYDALLREGHSGKGAVSVIVREFSPISYRWVEKIVNSPIQAPNELMVQAQLF